VKEMAGFAPLIAWAQKMRAMKLNIGTIRVNLTLETKIRSGWVHSEVILTGLNGVPPIGCTNPGETAF
jgi:hypothetical protein